MSIDDCGRLITGTHHRFIAGDMTMRAQCFKNYKSCVLEADYWEIAHDLDCAVTLTGCVKDAVFLQSGDSTEGANAGVRAALEHHSDELRSLNDRIRAAGSDGSDDKELERELYRLMDKVQRQPARQP